MKVETSQMFTNEIFLIYKKCACELIDYRGGNFSNRDEGPLSAKL